MPTEVGTARNSSVGRGYAAVPASTEGRVVQWMESLNEQQRAAATFGNDPLLIIAGAGTGKTNTLAHRVAYLIATGRDPSRILLLTFTRRASAEMLKRVEGILTRSQSSAKLSRVWGGTFHAIANRLLRVHSR